MVTTNAYREHVRSAGLEDRITQIAEGAGDFEGQRRAAREIRALIESTKPSSALARELAGGYERLAGGQRALVAVRSSATAEDLMDASFAGAQETYLGVRGTKEVLRAVVACWASLFTPQAIAYRQRFGHGGQLAMAVVVQTLVPAVTAGVMCTIDPVTGDRSQIAVEATPGLGVGLVGGEVSPDRFLIDKVTLDVRDREIGAKVMAYRLDDDGRVGSRPVPVEERGRLCIDEAEAVALAEVGRRIERELGSPQDVEWAFGPGDGGPRSMFLLQTRPETMWSRRVRPPMGGVADVTRRVAETFSTPVQLAAGPRGPHEGSPPLSLSDP